MESVGWTFCRSKRTGEISPEFQAMKAQAGEDPNHAFTLRIDIAYNRYLEDGVDISPVVYTAEEYEKYRLAGNPFIKNIDKDKIII